jgi:hypothetical protein
MEFAHRVAVDLIDEAAALDSQGIYVCRIICKCIHRVQLPTEAGNGIDCVGDSEVC